MCRCNAQGSSATDAQQHAHLLHRHTQPCCRACHLVKVRASGHGRVGGEVGEALPIGNVPEEEGGRRVQTRRHRLRRSAHERWHLEIGGRLQNDNQFSHAGDLAFPCVDEFEARAERGSRDLGQR